MESIYSDVQRLKVEGRTLVFGLDWYVANEGNPLSSAKDFIAGLKARGNVDRSISDLVVIRKGIRAQFSVDPSGSVAQTGDWSAAAILADIIGEENWLYVLDCGKFFWVCVGRDGFIDPSGDRVFSDDREEEAYAYVMSLDMGSFSAIHLPESWIQRIKQEQGRTGDVNVEDLVASRIEDLASTKPPSWARVYSPSKRVRSLALSLMGALALVGVAYFVWPEGGGAEDKNRVAQMRTEIARLKEEARKKEIARLDAREPWKDGTPFSGGVDACLHDMARSPIVMLGFDAKEVSCEDGRITVSYKRESGYSAWVRDGSLLPEGWSISISGNGNDAVLQSARSFPSPRGESVNKMDFAQFGEMKNVLVDAVQIEGAGLDVGRVVFEKFNEYPDYQPLFGKSEIKIVTSNPNVYADLLERFDGVVMSGMNYSIDDGKYHMSGVVFVSNPARE